MSHYIEQNWRHWSESRTRAALQHRFGVLAPLLTIAGLATLILWRVSKPGPRLVAPAAGTGT